MTVPLRQHEVASRVDQTETAAVACPSHPAAWSIEPSISSSRLVKSTDQRAPVRARIHFSTLITGRMIAPTRMLSSRSRPLSDAVPKIDCMKLA